LEGRAAYFFSSKKKRRSEVFDFATRLESMGETVAIGGFLRDLLLDGTRRFISDVDFVIRPPSLGEFERDMKKLNASRNRFGGYSIQLSRWKVEVWPLETTWAAVENHVDVTQMQDLLKVTFFNWDSILYSVSKRKVFASTKYFDQVSARFLDINLAPNPNPLGNAVRAVRYAHRWQAWLGRSLAEHIARQVKDVSWEVMANYERRSFGNSVMRFIDGDLAEKRLRCFLSSDYPVLQLTPKPEQLRLRLDDRQGENCSVVELVRSG